MACGVDGGCGGGDVEVVVWCVCVWVVGGVVVVVEGGVRVVGEERGGVGWVWRRGGEVWGDGL